MKTYIALFRGINVGGKNRLPMKELVAVLGGLGLEDVRTYIQSGNAVFRGPEDSVGLGEAISAAVGQSHGFTPRVHLLSRAAFDAAAIANPYPDAEADPKTLHLFFLGSRAADPDYGKLAAMRKDSERCELTGAVFYLHAPDGIGRSKLAAGAEAALGVPVTARNWRSVEKIRALAAAVDAD
ncbi:MAG: DUF1697 domain-containing protein [Acidobacteriota bacterium]